MIKLSILNAKDHNRIGDYLFHSNLIYIGSNHDADIYAPQEEIEKNHLFIEIVSGTLLVHLGKNVDHILVNSKRTTSFKKLKVGDIVAIGELKLKIIEFSETEIISSRDYLKQRVEEIQTTDKKYLNTLKSLSEAL